MLLENEPACAGLESTDTGLSICDETISFELSLDGLNQFAEDSSNILTSIIQEGMESLEGEVELPEGDTITIFSEIDMSAFSIEFSLDGFEAPDQNIGDDEALTREFQFLWSIYLQFRLELEILAEQFPTLVQIQMMPNYPILSCIF